MKKIFLMLIMALGTVASHAQKLSVNTDVTMLALQTYNLGAEMTIGNRSTLGLSVFGTKNPYLLVSVCWQPITCLPTKM